jgi:hypothetical protein
MDFPSPDRTRKAEALQNLAAPHSWLKLCGSLCLSPHILITCADFSVESETSDDKTIFGSNLHSPPSTGTIRKAKVLTAVLAGCVSEPVCWLFVRSLPMSCAPGHLDPHYTHQHNDLMNDKLLQSSLLKHDLVTCSRFAPIRLGVGHSQRQSKGEGRQAIPRFAPGTLLNQFPLH